MNMIIKKEAATLERTSANEGVQLQSLTLSEGTIRFEPDVTDYNVTVAEDVTKILVKGVTSDENSFYTVSGNTNLVKGKNEIVVTVIATGFEENENITPRSAQRPMNTTSKAPSSSPQKQEEATETRFSQQVQQQTETTDTLDIPTFLRNRRKRPK